MPFGPLSLSALGLPSLSCNACASSKEDLKDELADERLGVALITENTEEQPFLPTLAELDRGLQISPIYEYHSAAEKLTTVMRMSSSIFHQIQDGDEEDFAFDDDASDELQSPAARAPAVFESVRDRAAAAVQRARELGKRVAREPNDVYDCDWHEDLLPHLFGADYADTLGVFANSAKKIMAAQPSLAQATVACRIFGDLHGQLRDVLLLFDTFGTPDDPAGPSFVFNGDFVDRGSHQLEVIGLLFALKVMLPEKVWLVRGNHEDRTMNRKYGFHSDCKERLGKEYGQKLFDMIHAAFDQLPLACLVGERVLVLHGGIGDGDWCLNDIFSIKRPLTSKDLGLPKNRWIYNLLWSDPIEDDGGEHIDSDKIKGDFGVHESAHSVRGMPFGRDVTKTFCARNGLSLIVRSHQSKRDSLGIDVMHGNLLVRVFSARDYEGHGNDGATLLIDNAKEARVQGKNHKSLMIVKAQVLRATTKDQAEAQRKHAELEKTPTQQDEKVGEIAADKANPITLPMLWQSIASPKVSSLLGLGHEGLFFVSGSQTGPLQMRPDAATAEQSLVPRATGRA